MLKKIILSILVIICFISPDFLVYAHPVPMCTDIRGGEGSGWNVDESYHGGSDSIYYRFNEMDNNLTTRYRNMMNTGASTWGYGRITLTGEYDTRTPYTSVETYNNPYDTRYAYTTPISTPSNGHVSVWKICLNRYNSITASICAHELGHVFGLLDLYASQNYNKLMCGYGNAMTANSPTSDDMLGYNVIVGYHTAHTIQYTTTGATPNTAIHQKYCSVCHALKVESCTPTVGACIYCYQMHN